MKNFITTLFLLTLGIFSFNVFAQSTDDLGFFQKVFEYIAQFGGLTWAGKVAGGIFLLIGAFKVSFLSKAFDFLKEYKPLVPIALALIAGIVSLAIDPSQKITWAGVTAYILAGGGAILLNQLLDMVKALPGVGKVVVAVIDFLQIFLRSSSPLESKKLAAKKEVRENLAA